MNLKRINRFFLPALMVWACLSCAHEKIEVSTILCENKVDPAGVDVDNLNFSWKMVSIKRSQKQSAYQIKISSQEAISAEGKSEIWNSGKITSDKSILVKYSGPKLKSGTKYSWQVKVWDETGIESEWSLPGKFITGLIEEKDWSGAKWIAYDELEESKRIVPGIHAPNHSKKWKRKVSGDHVLPLLRKEFEVKKPLKSAYAFISGLGHYEMDLNEKKVGDHFIAPGWTHYDAYCLYNTFDITNRLNGGKNAIGVWLGNGFYNVPNVRYRKLLTAYGNPKMICKIQLNYEDGSAETIVSDDTWKTHAGPITFSSIYAGKIIMQF